MTLMHWFPSGFRGRQGVREPTVGGQRAFSRISDVLGLFKKKKSRIIEFSCKIVPFVYYVFENFLGGLRPPRKSYLNRC